MWIYIILGILAVLAIILTVHFVGKMNNESSSTDASSSNADDSTSNLPSTNVRQLGIGRITNVVDYMLDMRRSPNVTK